MEFQIEEEGFVTLKKINFKITRQYPIYRNNDVPLLGIVHLNDVKPIKNWGIVHTITNRVIICEFISKEEVESFFDFLREEMELDSIFLYADTNDIEKNFGDSFKKAYIKFSNKEEENEARNNI